MMPPELASIPPCLRRKPRPARRLLATIAVLAMYIVVPLALIFAVYVLSNAKTERPEPFYQQTANTPLQ